MKPSELQILKDILDVCPETNEPQETWHVTTCDPVPQKDGGVVIETRGATRAWRHLVITEEIPHPDEAPAGGWQPMPADPENAAPTRPAQPPRVKSSPET